MNEDEPEEQRPQKQTLCQSLRQDSHIKCLILTLLIGGCLGVITWCSVAEVTRMVVNFQSFPITTRRRVSPCDEGYIYIPIVLLVMLYLVYLVECWHCTTRLQLIYHINSNTVYNHIQRMRDAQPLIWWKAVCYHYVRQSRQVTRYRNGDAYTTTQIFYERVNTHVAGSCFSYGYCGVKDISKKLVDLENHPATKIHFTKGFAFANIEAANEFEDQRSHFFHQNERYDDYLEMREGLDLIGSNFQEYMISYSNSNCMPWYASHLAFWLFSLILLSWPYRIMIEYKTSHVDYQITKLFGESLRSPYSELCPMSRESTIDSVELISNYTIAPSYSEALLGEGTQLISDINVDEQHANQMTFGKDNESATNCASRSLQRVLRNGQIVYFVAPLINNTGETIIRRISSHDNDCVENPPSYEEALFRSHPLDQRALINVSPLRRSLTHTDFFRNLSNHLRRPWGSHLDIHLCQPNSHESQL